MIVAGQNSLNSKVFFMQRVKEKSAKVFIVPLYKSHMYGFEQNERGVAKHDLPVNVTHSVITSISQLNPYNTNATIKARVAFKAPLRTYSNQKGEGKLFHVDLVDASGEIKCTMFNETAEQFDQVFQVLYQHALLSSLPGGQGVLHLQGHGEAWKPSLH